MYFPDVKTWNYWIKEERVRSENGLLGYVWSACFQCVYQAVLEDCSFIMTLPTLDVIFYNDLLLLLFLVLFVNRCLMLSVVVRCAFLSAVRKLRKIRLFFCFAHSVCPECLGQCLGCGGHSVIFLLNEVTAYPQL